jgi:hypothetical protein
VVTKWLIQLSQKFSSTGNNANKHKKEAEIDGEDVTFTLTGEEKNKIKSQDKTTETEVRMEN